MLKLTLQIICDGCGQLFIFARVSDYTTDALGFNTRALTAMLPHYWWAQVKEDDERFHYCQECYDQFKDMERTLAPA
jgi:hypothetical protein